MTKFTSDITTIALDPCNFEPAVWTDCATKLRLKYLANHPELPKELKEAGLPADQAVLHILRLECFYRETHKIEMNMGMAKFVNFQQNGTALLAETFLLPHRKKGNYL